MSEKGIQTKNLIKAKAVTLFCEKGFSAVTMKDLCEACNLSRGGLYRHYESTRQIFEEILGSFSQDDALSIQKQMDDRLPATEILDGILKKLEQEMLDRAHSLSYAIYEYSMVCNDNFMRELNQRAATKWKRLLEYGIARGEFAPIQVDAMVDVILYLYQGVRMWSRIIPIEKQTTDRLIGKIRQDICGQ